MSWFTDERVKRLKRHRDELIDLLAEHAQAYQLQEFQLTAAQQQAARLQSENANVRQRYAKAKEEIVSLTNELDEARRTRAARAQAIADETRAKRYYDGQGDE